MRINCCLTIAFAVFQLFFCMIKGSHQNGCMNKSSDTLTDLLDIAEKSLHTAKKYAKLETRSAAHPMDCAEIKEKDRDANSGVFTIWPRNRIVTDSIKVYCDMEDDGGAWTVIQRRGDFGSPKDYFYRSWISYKYGFGDITKEFWLGNDNIFALTNQRANSLKFNLADWENNVTYAIYDDFWIDDEAHNYTSHVQGYRGTSGNGFAFTNGIPFSTKDRDNDKHSTHCAVNYKGAWWYAACHSSNLNGYYLKGAHESYADGVNWSSFRGQKYSLKDTTMKIRPKGFAKMIEFETYETPTV